MMHAHHGPLLPAEVDVAFLGYPDDDFPEYEMAFLLAHSRVNLDAPELCVIELRRGNFSMRDIKIAAISTNWDSMIDRAKRIRSEAQARLDRAIEEIRKATRFIGEFAAVALLVGVGWFWVVAAFTPEFV